MAVGCPLALRSIELATSHVAFDLPRGKRDEGGQGGSWEVGLEATSGSGGPKHIGKEREKCGKEITEWGEEPGVLFGMSQGRAARGWIPVVKQGRGHGP